MFEDFKTSLNDGKSNMQDPSKDTATCECFG